MTPEALPVAETAGTPEVPVASPHRRSGNDWRVLLALFTLAGVVESQAFGHFTAFTPLFLPQLNVAPQDVPTWTGILSSLTFIIGLPLLPFWGIWADRYGRKIIIVRSAYVEGVLFTIAALSPNVWVLAAARLLGGFVFGNTGVMLAMLADVTPRKRLGLAVGIASAGFPLGSSIGPYLGGQIVQHQGIRTLLIADAVASALVGIILTLAIRPELRARAGETAGKLLRAALRDIFGVPAVVRLFGLYFAAIFGIQLIVPFVTIRLQHLDTGDPKLLPSLVGATFTGAGIAMAITTPLWGRLGDVIGRARVLPICLSAVALGLLVEWAAPALLPFQVAYIAVGLFQGGIGTTVISLLALLAPIERRASILNFSLLPTQLSWFLAPLTGAALATVALTLPFLVGSIVVAFSLLISLLLLPRLLADAASH